MKRKYDLDEIDKADGIEFDSSGRMKYNPLYHFNHGKPFSEDDLEYLCKYHDIDGPRKVGLAIGRTECTCISRLDYLKKRGKYEHYRKLDKYYEPVD
jgi:hypothetical protein